ncbi:hypothetical protein BH11PSE2_BH11PSE2_04890 [soil metagenome]
MAETGFETDLEAMFDQAPAFSDDAVFARQVDGRLDKMLKTRRWVYGVCGSLGAAVAALELTQLDFTAGMQGFTTGVSGIASQAASIDMAPLASPAFLWSAAILIIVGAYLSVVLREQ